MLANLFKDNRDLALLVIRIAFGLIFALFGWRHVQGLQGYIGLYTSIGIPAPDLMAPFVAWIELLGGLAALVGIFTRYAGLLLAIVMVVSSATVKIPGAFQIDPATGASRAQDLLGLTNGGGWNIDFCLFAMGVALLFLGPGKIALVLFDVDGLKQLNDGCGHQTGDELLRLAARQLQGAAAGGASVYRIGGDEFAILLLRSKGGQLAAMLRCLKPFEAPFPDCAHQHMVRMSFGYASCEEGEGFESLFRRADLRLRESKDKLYGLRRIPEGDMHPEGEGDERLPRPERGLALIHSARG